MTPEPLLAYETRLEARRADVRVLEQRDRRLSLARAIVAAIAFAALIVTGSRPIAVVGLGLSALVFVALVIVHEKLAVRLARARRPRGFLRGRSSACSRRVDRAERKRFEGGLTGHSCGHSCGREAAMGVGSA